MRANQQGSVAAPVELEAQVVIPIHDASRPLRRAVASVLSDPEAGVIVVTHNLAADKLGLDLADPRVEVVSLKGSAGLPGAAFNAGVLAATAPWVAIMGSDDWFEPGALQTLRERAVEDAADFVIAPLAYQGGRRGFLPQTVRRRDLKAVRDRLFYRTAPLGLIRRTLLQDSGYRFDDTVQVGEDLRVSTRLFTSGIRVSCHPDDPAYVVGDDARERTTLASRPLRVQGAAWARIWDEPWVRNLPTRTRTALATKILRVHVLGSIEGRPNLDDWSPDDAQWLSELVTRICSENPRALRSIRSSSRNTLEALRVGDLEGALKSADEERAGTALAGMLPRSPLDLLLADGPARLQLADRIRGFLGPGRTPPGAPGAEKDRPTLLILSFSPIRRDARLLRQIALLTDGWEVTSCGYEQAPVGVGRHIELPSNLQPTELSGRLITARLYRAVYWLNPAIRNAWRVLRGAQFDAIIANDIEAVPLALRLRPRLGVLADLHEHYPTLHEYLPAWKRRIAPYMRWLLRTYATKAAAVTTVSGGLRDAYAQEFGLDAGVVPNAAMYSDLSPTPVSEPIRLVHSGACQRNRHLDTMAQAVLASTANVTLDFYLTSNDPAYMEELKAAYGESERVRFNDPVPSTDLVKTLNLYDVGVFILPPSTFSYQWALPNKLYDFIQARLGVVIGPSPEMARVVEASGNGAITRGFGAQDLREVLDGLTPEMVSAWKLASDAVAEQVSAEKAVGPWQEALRELRNSA